MNIKETPKISYEKPRKIPFKCPVCNTFGSLRNGSQICHACNGKGYVVIAQDNER